MRQDIIWTNDGLIKWCIYVSLCLNELRETEVFVMHLCIIREMQADSHSVCICNGRPRWTRITRTPPFWEYPPPPHDYPYYWVILDPKSKEDKVKVTNLKNLPKFQIFDFGNKHYTRHTICLIRCSNMEWIWCVLLKIQSGHDSVHRRTDEQTDRRTDKQGETSIPPFNFVEAGGIIMCWHFLYVG